MRRVLSFVKSGGMRVVNLQWAPRPPGTAPFAPVSNAIATPGRREHTTRRDPDRLVIA
jgi:hypothetical protein